MIVETGVKFEAGRYENMSNDGSYVSTTFDLDKDGNGYVINGAWYFKVLEFKLPYMKIEVLHPRGSYPAEWHNVVKI